MTATSGSLFAPRGKHTRNLSVFGPHLCPYTSRWVGFYYYFNFLVFHKAEMSALQAIKYTRGKLEVLDQLRLPHESVYDDVSTCEQAFDCIKSMRVRGIFEEPRFGLVHTDCTRCAGNRNCSRPRLGG